MIVNISFILNVAQELTDLQAPAQPWCIKNETDTDNIELGSNNNNNK